MKLFTSCLFIVYIVVAAFSQLPQDNNGQQVQQLETNFSHVLSCDIDPTEPSDSENECLPEANKRIQLSLARYDAKTPSFVNNDNFSNHALIRAPPTSLSS